MASDGGDTRDRQMSLRYHGRCRVCEASLVAGTQAIYEPDRRTVRCITCETASPTLPAKESQPIAAPPTAPARDGELRLRAPASSVIAETLRVQASAPPRSGVARLFGRSPLSADSMSWYLGALGELEVARVLDQLGPEWSVIHAIPIGSAGSDIDHLAIGPAGVFTINSKFHEGTSVWVGSRRLLVNGHPIDHLRNARFEASRVAKLLSRAHGRPVEVTPVVAIVGAKRITVKERPADVIVVASNRLVRHLTSSPAALRPEEAEQLRRLANDPATWGQASVPEADLTGFADLRESVARARRRRGAWALAALLGPFAVLAASVMGLMR